MSQQGPLQETAGLHPAITAFARSAGMTSALSSHAGLLPCTSNVISNLQATAHTRSMSLFLGPHAASGLSIQAHQVQEVGKFQPHGKPMSEVVANAGSKALGGGLPGAAAMALQVVSLMWMRTTINYQYRYGTSTMTAFRTLYKDGGVARFYRGLAPALLQAPLSRFGDTAANAGVLALLDSYPATYNLPVAVKTLAASLSAGAFRILLMPIDTTKSIMQVEGKDGFKALVAKVNKGGPRVLFHGALAASAATFVGHYPWFAVYNYLNATLPRYEHDLPMKLVRSAAIGFCASAVSDTVSNSIRVIKTSKQTATVPKTYVEVAKEIIAKEGVLGLMGRGLVTKLIANGVQGMLFSVFWRLGQDYYTQAGQGEAAATTLVTSTARPAPLK